MPTLNLLNSITPTGEWATDSIAPYDMQPYDFSLIQTDVVLDAANQILEITNIPVGAMIANPPLNTAPYDSSFIRIGGTYEIIFKVVSGIPTIHSLIIVDPGVTVVINNQQYSEVNRLLSANTSIYIDEVFFTNFPVSFQFEINSIQNNILIGDVYYILGTGLESTQSLIVNEIASSYSVVSTDPANRKAIIRVNGNIDNLKPPLNRLFLNFDKTP